MWVFSVPYPVKETGDVERGDAKDYVTNPYIGDLGKTDPLSPVPGLT
jgi:hypothetical protein